MCRRPVYFKGFHKMRDEWNEEAWESRCADVFSEVIDEAFENARILAAAFSPRMYTRLMNEALDDIKDAEKTYRYLKSEDVTSDDIEYVLLDTYDYYSDRHINKVWWCDEPQKQFETRYPWLTQSTGGSPKRVRAREDPWVTLSFYVEL